MPRQRTRAVNSRYSHCIAPPAGRGRVPCRGRRAPSSRRAHLLGVVGDAAVDRDRRAVVVLEVVAELLAGVEPVDLARSARSAVTSVTRSPSRSRTCCLVAPERRRLGARAAAGGERLHGREHLADEALRRPVDQCRRGRPASSRARARRRRPGGAARTSRPRVEMHRRRTRRRRTAAPRHPPRATRARHPPRSASRRPTSKSSGVRSLATTVAPRPAPRGSPRCR